MFAGDSNGRLVAGRYRVERCLGAGPVSSVSAVTRADGTVRALKSLNDEFAGAEKATRRFACALLEAQRLRSRHSARVFDVGQQNVPFGEVELLHGPSLAQVLRDSGPLAIADACRYTMQACEALAEAHGLGFIHGNLNLENWFLEPSAEAPAIKLTDFGASRSALTGFAYDDPDMQDAPLHRIELPHYDAPERLSDPRARDPRSDIWSAGVALFAMLTGRFPFEGETLFELCGSIANERPLRLGQLRPDAPCGVASIVDRCLDADPARRYQSAAELALALLPFAGGRLEISASSDARAPIVRSEPPPAPCVRSEPPPSSLIQEFPPAPRVPVFASTEASDDPSSDMPALPTRSRLPIFVGAALLVAAAIGGVTIVTSAAGDVAHAARATHSVDRFAPRSIARSSDTVESRAIPEPEARATALRTSRRAPSPAAKPNVYDVGF